MNQMQNPSFIEPFVPPVLIATFAVVGFLVVVYIYRRYTGLTRGPAGLIGLLAVGAAAGYIVFKRNEFHYSGRASGVFVPGAVLLSFLVLPFAVRLYCKWIGGHLTEAEKMPGIDGVRAWLGVGNIICAVLIPLCVWQVFGISPLPIAALTFGALLAYPLLSMASQPASPAPSAPAEDLSSEREKVLHLLEVGKISATDSAELLNALTHSALPPPKPAAEINPQRKLVLIGAAVLLLGFFLPWFSINTGQEMNRAMSQLQQNMRQQMPMAGNMAAQMPQFNASTPTVQVCGGDIGHGLGWWILALGVVAAVLPFFASNLDAQTQKKVMLASLGVGAVMLIYLFTNGWRYVSFGLLLALVGYALEFVGTLKEQPVAR